MKALIIEDEIWIARELDSTLREVADDVEVVDILPSLKVARKWFLEHAEPDLIFMDIQLSDGISFSLFDEFELHCPVIFTTAYDEYAVQAFKVNGVDYILKPVKKEELQRALDKCRKILESRSPYPNGISELLASLKLQTPDVNKYKQRFIVHFRNQWIPVNVQDIACFVKDNLIYLHTFSGDKHIMDFESMEDIETLLDPSLFYRANRQFIVNIDAIRSVSPRQNAKLVASLIAPLNTEVDISREKAPLFKKWFDR